METKTPRKPKRKLTGVHTVWSGGKWKFIARFRGGGELVYGTVRETQAEAYDDYRRLKENARGRRFNAIRTLEAGIAAARVAAVERNLAPSTIKAHFGHRGSHATYLLGWWRPETPLKLLTPKVVAKFIREAMEEGRSPNSLIKKDLLVIGDIMRAAGLPNPVPEAKKLAKLKKVAPLKEHLDFEVAQEFIQRIRSEVLRDKKGRIRNLPRRHWHADIAELILWTGGRSSEITNLNLKSGQFYDHPKDGRVGVLELCGKTGPRRVPMDEGLAAIVHRLNDDAKKAGRTILVPGGKDGLKQIINRWSERLGCRAHARILRHTIAMGMLDAGLTLDRVRDQLGHANVTTTAEYIKQRRLVKADSIQKLRKHFQPPDSSGQSQSS